VEARELETDDAGTVKLEQFFGKAEGFPKD